MLLISNRLYLNLYRTHVKIEEYKTRERIGQLNADTLQTIDREKNPRLGFLYLNMKVIKKKCTPGKVYYDDEE